MDELVTADYEMISTTVKTGLSRNCVSASDDRAKAAFTDLQRMMSDLYSKQPSRKLLLRARREHRLMKRLQRLIQSRPDNTICRIDKNPAFYMGSTAMLTAKAQEYMTTTAAYEEIRNGHCPLADHLHAVRTLLGYLVSRKAITKDKQKKLLPGMGKLKLAHFHGLPKVHKVSQSLSLSILMF